MSAVKRSDIFLAAWVAAEKALPQESRHLIEVHDALHAAWRNTGWGPVPPELTAAAKAVEADPLASIAFDLRHRTNDEAHAEWRVANPAA